MKRTVAACVVLWTFFGPVAIASPGARGQMDLSGRCVEMEGIASLAASYRQEGMSPQQVYAAMKGQYMMPPPAPKPPAALLKSIINTVFFDPQAQQMTPNQVGRAIFNGCYYGPPPTYQPLR